MESSPGGWPMKPLGWHSPMTAPPRGLLLGHAIPLVFPRFLTVSSMAAPWQKTQKISMGEVTGETGPTANPGYKNEVPPCPHGIEHLRALYLCPFLNDVRSSRWIHEKEKFFVIITQSLPY